MARALKVMLLVHVVLDVVFGLPLLLMPGRFLTLLGWAPIDPIISRILGAALLAFGWVQLRAWQAGLAECAPVLEMEVAFSGLACIGLLRHLLFARYPAIVWVVFAVFAALLVSSAVALWGVRPAKAKQ